MGRLEGQIGLVGGLESSEQWFPYLVEQLFDPVAGAGLPRYLHDAPSAFDEDPRGLGKVGVFGQVPVDQCLLEEGDECFLPSQKRFRVGFAGVDFAGDAHGGADPDVVSGVDGYLEDDLADCGESAKRACSHAGEQVGPDVVFALDEFGSDVFFGHEVVAERAFGHSGTSDDVGGDCPGDAVNGELNGGRVQKRRVRAIPLFFSCPSWRLGAFGVFAGDRGVVYLHPSP